MSELKVGQKWKGKLRSNSQERIVQVEGIDGTKVTVRHKTQHFTVPLSRFTNQAGGYELVKDVA